MRSRRSNFTAFKIFAFEANVFPKTIKIHILLKKLSPLIFALKWSTTELCALIGITEPLTFVVLGASVYFYKK